MQILASDTAREASEAIHAILGQESRGRPSDRFFQADHRGIWNEIVNGGWTALGLEEKRGGAELQLLDLAIVAEAWGQHLVPLPYIPTMLLRRWGQSDAAMHGAAMLTYGLGLPGTDVGPGIKAHALAPFLGVPGVQYATGVAPLAHVEFAAIPVPASADHPYAGGAKNDSGKPRADYAPSLPLGRAPVATAGLSDEAKVEIAVLGASELIGCGSALLEITIEYARDRKQFGHPIADYQAIQHRLANMHRDIEVARTAVIWAVNEPAQARGAARIVWDRMRTVTENGFQIHGGFGFTWDGGVHYYSRHVWAMGQLLRACGVRLWPN